MARPDQILHRGLVQPGTTTEVLDAHHPMSAAQERLASPIGVHCHSMASSTLIGMSVHPQGDRITSPATPRVRTLIPIRATPVSCAVEASRASLFGCSAPL